MPEDAVSRSPCQPGCWPADRRGSGWQAATRRQRQRADALMDIVGGPRGLRFQQQQARKAEQQVQQQVQQQVLAVAV